MTQTHTSKLRDFLAPKFWPTWLGIGSLCLIAWLPWFARMQTGRLVGLLSFHLARERRYITRTNIAICFPELDSSGQDALTRKTFIANGIGLIETGTGWVRSARHFQNQLHIIGLEVIKQAKAEGRGVLMLGAHYSTLDFSANLLSLTCPFAVTYRPHKNPLFDRFMHRGRVRNCNGVFDRSDIRGAFRHLKKGEVLWYAPDQDYGPEHAAFAPFFGFPAATINTPARFAAFNDSPVVVVRHHRLEDRKGYELEFTRLNSRFPSGDEVLDATLINAQLEKDIRHFPHQYLWLHKRFKTQPGGKPESPYINIKTPRKSLSKEQFNTMCSGAKTVEEQHSRKRNLKLVNGLYLRVFADIPGRFFSGRHPALLFDRRSKQLRMAGIASITTDNIFKVAQQGLTAVTYFAPEGDSLREIVEDKHRSVPLKALASLYAALHAKGFSMATPRLQSLVFHNNNMVILNPEQIRVSPMSLCYIDRCKDLEQLFLVLKKQDASTVSHFSEISILYTDMSGLSDNSKFLHELDKLSAHKSVFQSLYSRSG